jgi:hypothetical protein
VATTRGGASVFETILDWQSRRRVSITVTLLNKINERKGYQASSVIIYHSWFLLGYSLDAVGDIQKAQLAD